MPRRKTVKDDSIDKKAFTALMNDIRVGTQDQIGQTVAQLVRNDNINEQNAQTVTAALQAAPTFPCLGRWWAHRVPAR